MILNNILFRVGGALMFAVAFPHYAAAQDATSEQFKLGSDTYARHCSACHGARMKNPEGAFDLPTFPKDGKDRFVRSVSKGKNSMPPWDGLLKPDEIEALWAYVYTGEK
jgi:mono/diheme cytochrome c family protein